jgi:hypothetical protein
MEIGCPGWIRTSTVPFNKRADYYYPTGQKLTLPAGLAPAIFPQTTGRFAVQLRKQKWPASRSRSEGWWEALVTLQFVTSNFI